MTHRTEGGTTVLERTPTANSNSEPKTLFSQLTRDDRILSVMSALNGISSQTFGTIKDIENTELAALRAMSVAGNAFEPIAKHLTTHGHPTTTVGGAMDVLDLDKNDVHMIACYCHESDDMISAASISQNLARVSFNSV